MSTKWTYSIEKKIIDLYKERRSLWDPKFRDYFNREKRKKLLNEIVTELGDIFTVEDIKEKIRNLRTTFMKQMKKEKNRIRWMHYQNLSFLNDIERTDQNPTDSMDLGHMSANAEESEGELKEDEDGVELESELVPMILPSTGKNREGTKRKFQVHTSEESEADSFESKILLESPSSGKRRKSLKKMTINKETEAQEQLNSDSLHSLLVGVLQNPLRKDNLSADDYFGLYVAEELKKCTNPRVKGITKLKIQEAFLVMYNQMDNKS